MKLLLIVCGSLICLSTCAQQDVLNALKSGKTAYIYLEPDIYKMNIGKVSPNNQTYMYNNGNGLDIYKSQPDNMPALKPEGFFSDKMSNARITPSKSIIDAINNFKGTQFQPKGLSKYDFILPLTKILCTF